MVASLFLKQTLWLILLKISSARCPWRQTLKLTLHASEGGGIPEAAAHPACHLGRFRPCRAGRETRSPPGFEFANLSEEKRFSPACLRRQILAGDERRGGKGGRGKA